MVKHKNIKENKKDQIFYTINLMIRINSIFGLHEIYFLLT